jgi:hypothetical protein
LGSQISLNLQTDQDTLRLAKENSELKLQLSDCQAAFYRLKEQNVELSIQML